MSDWFLPLMDDNITRKDINRLISFLQQDPIPRLTNGPKVLEFEQKWSEWLGVKYSLMVNSGSAANELTLMALKYLYGDGEVIVPPLTWISDIASVLHAGLKPIFCDINLTNLSFDIEKLKKLINNNTRAIFLTHVLGINGLTQELLNICEQNNIKLIEDVCESHGTLFQNKKVGSYGFASNFSMFMAHHISCIEGGIICTNDFEFYQVLRALRSHGMLREMTDSVFKEKTLLENPQLNKDFVFLAPAHNFRSTELNAVLGLSQLEDLDANNEKRKSNFDYFIQRLDPYKYHTNLEIKGQCNYAFIVILKEPSFEKRDLLEATFNKEAIEFRRGLSGGGSQLKQPYAKQRFNINEKDFPNIEHIHHFSWYIGNYPRLERSKIDKLLQVLNNT